MSNLVFTCYRGQQKERALLEEGCFPVTDTQGREWLCHPEKAVPDEELLADVMEIHELEDPSSPYGPTEKMEVDIFATGIETLPVILGLGRVPMI